MEQCQFTEGCGGSGSRAAGALTLLRQRLQTSVHLLAATSLPWSPSFAHKPQDCELLYIAFDVLHDGQRSLVAEPLRERQRLLEQVGPGGGWCGAPAACPQLACCGWQPACLRLCLPAA